MRLATAVPGVVAVHDELSVGPAANSTFQDTIISQRLESLLFDSGIKAVNYGVLTHNAVVYLMGVARSAWELDRVIAHARNTPYVRGVVSHVRVRADAAAPEP
ncbi:MAG: BON domain-containing protein [Alphaproteobacteria bacterium]